MSRLVDSFSERRKRLGGPREEGRKERGNWLYYNIWEKNKEKRCIFLYMFTYLFLTRFCQCYLKSLYFLHFFEILFLEIQLIFHLMNLYLISYLTFCFVYIIIYIFVYIIIYILVLYCWIELVTRSTFHLTPYLWKILIVFWGEVSLCNPSWPWTCLCRPAGLKLKRDWPTSAPQIAGIKGIATMAGPWFWFLTPRNDGAVGFW